MVTTERKAIEADEHDCGGSKGQSASNPVKFVQVPEAEFTRLKAQIGRDREAYETRQVGAP